MVMVVIIVIHGKTLQYMAILGMLIFCLNLPAAIQKFRTGRVSIPGTGSHGAQLSKTSAKTYCWRPEVPA